MLRLAEHAILTLKQISTKSFWKFNCSWSWYSMGYICCVFCNAFDEFVRIDFNCKSSLPLCLSGYSEHQIHLHITQFWQIVSFAPKFSTFVIEMDANSQNENCSILEPEAACCWKKIISTKPKSFLCQLRWEIRRQLAKCFGSLWEFCGSRHWSETESPNLSAFWRFRMYTHKAIFWAWDFLLVKRA